MKIHDFQVGNLDELELEGVIGKRAARPARLHALLQPSQESLGAESAKIVKGGVKAGEDTDRGPIEQIVLAAKDLLPRCCDGALGAADEKETARLESAFREETDDWRPTLAALVCHSVEHLNSRTQFHFALALDELNQYQERLRAARAVQQNAKKLAEKTAHAFMEYCRAEGHRIGKADSHDLAKVLGAYFEALPTALRGNSRSEVALRHSLLWSELILPRYELDVLQWTFLLACLEQALYQETDSRVTREIASYLADVAQATVNLNVIGLFRRNLGKLEADILSQKDVPFLPFEWTALIRLLLGELVCAEASLEASFVQSHIFSAEEVLGGVEPGVLRSFISALINRCRDLVERNWLDLLEDALLKVADNLEAAKLWREAESARDRVVARATLNLNEALDIFESQAQLETDVKLILHRAFISTRVTRTMTAAKLAFRRWFACYYAIPFTESWNLATPVVRAVLTSARQDDEFDLFSNDSTEAEVLNTLENVARSASDVLQELESAEFTQQAGELTALQSSALVYRAASDSVLWTTDGVRQTANWCLRGSWIEPAILESKATRVGLQKLAAQLGSESLASSVKRLADLLPRIALSLGLWRHSEDMGSKAAAVIYREMAEYGQLTGGKAGEQKCARDSAFTLRRLALSLAPSTSDPGETFGTAWRALVDRYVHNRPAGLFRTTAAALVKVVSEHFDTVTTEVAEGILIPVYELADTAHEVKTQHEVLVWEGAWEDGKLPDLREFLVEHSAVSLDYSRKFLSKDRNSSLDENSLETFRDILEDGYSSYSKLGVLSTRACSRWVRHCDSRDYHSWSLERYMVSLLYQAGDTPNESIVSRLKRLDYIQAWVEFNRQYRVGLELNQRSASIVQALSKAGFSEETAGSLVAELAHIFQSTPPVLSPWEVSRLAFAGCGRKKFSARDWAAFTSTLDEQSQKVLTPVCSAELRSFLVNWSGLSKELETWESALHMYEASDEPIFSPVPEEDSQWRSVLTLVLSAPLYGPSLFSHLQYLFLSSFEIVLEPDFKARLLQAVDFLELKDVEQVAQRCLKFAERSNHFKAIQNLAKVSSEGQEFGGTGELWPKDIQSFTNLALSLVRRSHFPLMPGSRWGVSPNLRLFPSQWETEKVEASQVESLTQTLKLVCEKIAPEPALIGDYLDTIARQLGSLPTLDRLWTADWSLGGAFQQEALGSNPCRRDGKWSARRILVEDWSGTGSSFDWYRREIVPHIGRHKTEHYIHMMCDLAGQLCGHPEAGTGIVQAALSLRDQVLDALLRGSQSEEPAARLLNQAPAASKPGFPSLNQEMAPAEMSFSVAQALDYAGKFSDLPNPDWAKSVVLVLKIGYREYEQSLLIGPDSLARWYPLLSQDSQSGIALERFLIGLIYQADEDCPDPLAALARIDYLQAQIDAVRQVDLGAALVHGNAKLVDSWTGSSKASAEGISHLINAWARASLSRPRAMALYEMVRSWTGSESLGDYAAPNEWRELWKSFLRVSISQLEPNQQLTAQNFVRSFNPLSEAFPFLGCMGGRNQEPLFLPACSVIALAVLEGADSSLARLVRAHVVHDATRAELSEFQGHLRLVGDYLTESLLSNDLDDIDQEAERCVKVYQHIKAWGELEPTLHEKAAKFAERLPGLAAEQTEAQVRLIRALSYRFLPERALTTWGFPRELRALPVELIKALEESDRGDYDKWVSAWAAALGRNGLAKDDFIASAERLRTLLEWRKDLVSAWSASWSLDTNQYGKACERDLGWLARRLSAEGWFGDGDSRQVARWYIREVIPYAGDVEPKAYAKYVKSAAAKIGSEVSFPENVRQLATSFRRRVETAAKGQSDKKAFREALVLGLDFDDSTLEKSQGFFSRLADSFESLVSGR